MGILSAALLVLLAAAPRARAIEGTTAGNFATAGGATYDLGLSHRSQAMAVLVDTVSVGGPFIYVTGYSENNGNGDKNLVLLKYDGEGVLQNQTEYDGDDHGDDTGEAVVLDPQGNIVVAGTTRYGGRVGLLVLRYDPSLALQGTPGIVTEPGVDFEGHGVAVDPSGSIYAAGQAWPVEGSADFIVAKFDPALVFVSSAGLHPEESFNHFAYSIAVVSTGTAPTMTGTPSLLVYGSGGPSGSVQFMLASYSTDLALLGSSYLAPSGMEGGYLAVAPYGQDMVFGAGSFSMGGGAPDFFVQRLNSSGLGAVGDPAARDGGYGMVDEAFGAAVGPSNQVYVAGSFQKDNEDGDFSVARFDTGLAFVSSASYDSGLQDAAMAVAAAGRYVYAAGWSDVSGGGRVMRLARFDLTGGDRSTGVTRVWTGLGVGAEASKPDNWLGNEVPRDGDGVLFPLSFPGSNFCLWDLGASISTFTVAPGATIGIEVTQSFSIGAGGLQLDGASGSLLTAVRRRVRRLGQGPVTEAGFYVDNGKEVSVFGPVNVAGGRLRLDGGTLSARDGITLAGEFQARQGAHVYTNSIYSTLGSTFKLYDDTQSGGPTLDSLLDGTLGIDLNGAVDISAGILRHTAAQGLKIGGTAGIIELSHLRFESARNPGSVALVLFGLVDKELVGLSFEDTENFGGTVDGTALQEGSSVTLTDAQGPMAGSAHEVDNFDFIHWNPDASAPPPPLSLGTASGDFSSEGGATFDFGRNAQALAAAANAAAPGGPFIYVAGYSADNPGPVGEGTPIPHQNAVVLRYGPGGAVTAQASFDGTAHSDDAFEALALDAQGNVYAVGRTRIAGDDDFLLVKYDANLLFIASAAYDNGGQQDRAHAVTIGSDGTVYVVGETVSQTQSDFLLLSVNSDLGGAAMAGLDAQDGVNKVARGVALVEGGEGDNLLVVGTKGDGELSHVLTTAFLPGWQLLSTAEDPTSFGEGRAAAADRYHGGLAFAAGLVAGGESAGWFLRRANAASPQYDSDNARFGVGFTNEGAYAAAVGLSNEVYTAGETRGSGNLDVTLVRRDSQLNFLSSSTYDGQGDERVRALALAGGYAYVAGYGNPSGEREIFRVLRFSIPEQNTGFVRHWSGGGANVQASNGANWTGGVPPQPGDAVQFDGGAEGLNPDADWDLSTFVATFSVTNGYTGGIHATQQLRIGAGGLSYAGADPGQNLAGRRRAVKRLAEGGPKASGIPGLFLDDDSSGSHYIDGPFTIGSGQVVLGHVSLSARSGTALNGGLLEIHNHGTLYSPSLQSAPGSTFRMRDDNLVGPPFLDGGDVPMDILLNGSVDISSGILKNFGADGLKIGGAATVVELSHLSFESAINGHTALTLFTGGNGLDLVGLAFGGINYSVNVDASNLPGGASVTLTGASGEHAGSAYANDPNHVLTWNPDPHPAGPPPEPSLGTASGDFSQQAGAGFVFDSGDAQAQALAVDDRGPGGPLVYAAGYFVNAGVGSGQPPPQKDIAVLQYNDAGQVVHKAAFDGAAHHDDEADGAVVGPDGSLYLVGTTEGFALHELLVLKYAPGLVFVASATVSAGFDARGHAIALSADGTALYVAGEGTVLGEPSFQDFLVAKLNTDLVLLSTAGFNAQDPQNRSANAVAYSFVEGTPRVLVLGTQGDFNNNEVPDKIVLAGYSPDLEPLISISTDGLNMMGNALAVDRYHQGLAWAGGTFNPHAFRWDWWTTRIDPSGGAFIGDRPNFGDDNAGNDVVYAAAAGLSNEVYFAGGTGCCGSSDMAVVRRDVNMNFVSSAAYASELNETAKAVAVSGPYVYAAGWQSDGQRSGFRVLRLSLPAAGKPTGFDRVWTGAGSSYNASDAGNWEGGVVPQPGDGVVFRPDRVQGLVCNWDLNVYLTTFTVQAGVPLSLTVAGPLDIGPGGLHYAGSLDTQILAAARKLRRTKGVRPLDLQAPPPGFFFPDDVAESRVEGPVVISDGLFSLARTTLRAQGGVLLQGGTLLLHNAASLLTPALESQTGSTFRMADDNFYGPSVLDGAGRPLDLLLEGTVDLSSGSFRDLGPKGLRLDGAASLVELSHLAFETAFQEQSAALTLTGAAASGRFLSGLGFAAGNFSVNVDASSASGDPVTLQDCFGDRAGSSYSNDPGSLLVWSPDPNPKAPPPPFGRPSGSFSDAGGAVLDFGQTAQAHALAIDSVSAGGPYLYLAGAANVDGNADGIVFAYDPSGAVIGYTQFDSGLGGTEMFLAAAPDGAGGLYAAGFAESGARDALVVHYDGALNMVSSAAFNAGALTQAQALAVDSAGGVYAVGRAALPASSIYDVLVVKFSPDLVFVSSAGFNADGSNPDARAALVVSTGGVERLLVFGSIDENAPRSLLVSYSLDLAVLASSTSASGVMEQGRALAADPRGTGEVYGAGVRGGFESGDVLVQRADPGGTGLLDPAVVQDYGSDDSLEAMAAGPEGEVYLAGQRETGFGYDTFLERRDAHLVFVASASYNSGGNDEARAVAAAGAYVYVAGASYEKGYATPRLLRFLLRTPAPVLPGQRVWTGLSGSPSALNPGNWEGGLVPRDGDGALFGAAGAEAPCDWDLSVTLDSFTVESAFDAPITFYSQLRVGAGGVSFAGAEPSVVQAGKKALRRPKTTVRPKGEGLGQGGQLLLTPASGSSRVEGPFVVASGLVAMDQAQLQLDGGLRLNGGRFQLHNAGIIGASSITAAQGSTFEVYDDNSAGYSTIASTTSEGMVFLYLDGTVRLNSVHLRYLAPGGLVLGPNAAVSELSNIAFESALLPGSTALTLLGGANGQTFDNLAFNDLNFDVNVDLSSLPPGSTLFLTNASGPRAGSLRSNDPRGLTSWSPDASDVDLSGPLTLAPGTHRFTALRLLPGANITCQSDPNSGLGVTLVLRSLTIDAGAVLGSDGQGYPGGRGNPPSDGSGPGAGTKGPDFGGGGGHGGAGAGAGTGEGQGGAAYDSETQPAQPGSGGGAGAFLGNAGGPGGGAIHIMASGAVQVDGSLTANGLQGSVNAGQGGGGAGGSIWIEAASLAGSGVISAIGGAGGGQGAGGGGGGRVSVQVGSFLFQGQAALQGGLRGGERGTFYTGVSGGSGSPYFFSGNFSLPSGAVIASTSGFNEAGRRVRAAYPGGPVFVLFLSTPGAAPAEEAGWGLARYDANGVLGAVTSLAGDRGRGAMAVDPSGSVYLGGADASGAWLERYDFGLSLLATLPLADAERVDALAFSGSLLYAGLRGTQADPAAKVAAYDPALSPVASRPYALSGQAEAESLALDGMGGVYASVTDGTRRRLVKYDGTLALLEADLDLAAEGVTGPVALTYSAGSVSPVEAAGARAGVAPAKAPAAVKSFHLSAAKPAAAAGLRALSASKLSLSKLISAPAKFAAKPKSGPSFLATHPKALKGRPGPIRVRRLAKGAKLSDLGGLGSVYAAGVEGSAWALRQFDLDLFPVASASMTAGTQAGSFLEARTGPLGDLYLGGTCGALAGVCAGTDYLVARFTSELILESTSVFNGAGGGTDVGTSLDIVETGLAYITGASEGDAATALVALPRVQPTPPAQDNGGFNGGGQASGVAGEGSGSVDPSSVPAAGYFSAAVTLHVGASGILPGGVIELELPDTGWGGLQDVDPGAPAYVTVLAYSTGTAYLQLTGDLFSGVPQPISGSRFAPAQVYFAALNPGDTVQFLISNLPAPCLSGLQTLTLHTSGAQGVAPRPLAASPEVEVLSGEPSSLYITQANAYAKVGKVSSALTVQALDDCGNPAPALAPYSLAVQAVRYDAGLDQYVADAGLQFSSSAAGPFAALQGLGFETGRSSAPLYILASGAPRSSEIELDYDLGFGPGNYFTPVNVLAGDILSGVDLSSGPFRTGARRLSLLPVDASRSTVFIGIDLGDPGLSWTVRVAAAPFADPKAPPPAVWEAQGSGLLGPGELGWDGRYNAGELAGSFVPSGTYYVLVEAGGEADTGAVIDVIVPELKGRVTVGGSTQTVAGAFVVASGEEGSGQAETDSQGGYTIPGLPAGTYEVDISADGYLDYRAQAVLDAQGGTVDAALTPADLLKVAVSAASGSTVPFELYGELEVSGGDFDETQVLRLAAGASQADDGGQYDTALGRFVLSSSFTFRLSPGSYEVRASLPGFFTVSTTVAVAAGGRGLDLPALARKASLFGAVTLPAAAGSSGLSVAVTAASTASLAGASGGVFSTQADIPPGASSAAYRIYGVDPGAYILFAGAYGLPRVSSGSLTAPIPVGLSDVQADLPSFVQGAGISGRVTVNGDTSGLGTFQVQLNAWSPKTSSYGSLSVSLAGSAEQASSTYTLAGLQVGTTYQLYIRLDDSFQSQGAQPLSVFVDAASKTGVDLVLNQSSGSIQGTLILPSSPDPDFSQAQLTLKILKSANPNEAGKVLTYQADQLPGFAVTAPGRAAFALSKLNTLLASVSVSYGLTGYTKTDQVSVVNGKATALSVDLSGQTLSISGSVINRVTRPGFESVAKLVGQAVFSAPSGYPVSAPSGSARWVYAVRQDFDAFNAKISSTTYDPSTTRVGFVSSTGSYVISGVQPGAWLVRTLPLQGSATGAVVVPASELAVSLATASVSGADLILADGASVSGSIGFRAGVQDARAFKLSVSNQRGEVVASTNVAIGNQAANISGTAAPYVFRGLPAGGFYTLSVTDAGTPVKYLARDLRFPDPGAAPRGLQSDLPAQNVTLRRAATFKAKLRDANSGQIITQSNATLLATSFTCYCVANPWVDGGYVAAAAGVSGRPVQADGTVQIGPLFPGVAYDLHCEQTRWDAGFLLEGSQNYTPIVLSGLTPNSGGEVRDLGVLDLNQGLTITGRVRDSAKNPLANIPIQAKPAGGDAALGSVSINTLTDAQGAYSLWVSTYISQVYSITAAPRQNNAAAQVGASLYLPSTLRLNLAASATADFILSQAVSPVTGTVTTEDGRGLSYPFGAQKGFPAAALFLQPSGAAPVTNPLGDIQALTNPDGTFSVPGLSTGTYLIRAASLGYAVSSGTVRVSTAGADAGTIVLKRGGTLSGSILKPDPGSDSGFTQPGSNEIASIAAANADLTAFVLGTLNLNAQTGQVEGYTLSGLQPNIVYNLGLLPAVEGESVYFPSQGLGVSFGVLESTATRSLNLVYRPSEVECRGQIKLRDGGAISLKLACPRPLRSQTQADNDPAFASPAGLLFASTGTTAGTLSDKKLSRDRTVLKAVYTPAAGESRFSVRLHAFTTSMNPATGSNFEIDQVFSFFTGLKNQQTRKFSNLQGGCLALDAADESSSSEENSGLCVDQGAFISSATGLTDSTLSFQLGMRSALNISQASASRARTSAAGPAARAYDPAALPPELAAAMSALEPGGAKASSARTQAASDARNPLSSFYDIFLPAGIRSQLKKAAQLTLTYDPALSSATSLGSLNVFYYNPLTSKYVIEDANKSIDSTNHTISVDVNHFSVFVVLASTPVLTSSNPFTGGELEVHNFPNPFNLEPKTKTINSSAGSGSFSNGQSVTLRGTMIRLGLPAGAASTGRIRIYDVGGELVRQIDMAGLAPSSYEYFEWDGRNSEGSDAASGIYIGEVQVGDQKKYWKMALIKNPRYR